VNPTEKETLAWLAGMQAGDEAAAQQFYRAYAPTVKSFLLRGGWEIGVVEDAVQATMIEVWKHPDRFQPGGRAQFKTWLLRIAQFRLTDLLRKQPAQAVAFDEAHPNAQAEDGEDFMQQGDEGHESDDGMPVEVYAKVHQAQRKAALAQCMDRLKGLHRQMLSMAYEHEMPGREIAERLEMPEGTVKSTLHYAKGLIRKCLERQFREVTS